MDPLLCLSPCDGRYHEYTKCCIPYFSEFAIQKKRIRIEILYLQRLIRFLPQLKDTYHISTNIIGDIYTNFNLDECKKVKDLENIIKHDVKAVELYIKEKLIDSDLNNLVSFIHFGLTSQDINNVVYPVIIKEFITNEYCNLLHTVIHQLENMYKTYHHVIMLSHTHGQPGVPTSFGKEMKVFQYRLLELLTDLNNIKYKCKFGGAVGNFNAHVAAYPQHDWATFADNFINSFQCSRSQFTTQIDNYENLSVIFDTIKRINSVLIDLCQDIWLYIFKDYLLLNIDTKEVGSSTMPHKVNPINFENAEGNLGLSNALFEFMSRKLPISRLQRDLTDSTVLRNIGLAFGYSVIALKNIHTGLNKIYPNEVTISHDLYKNTIVLSEAYQTILRKHGMDDAYDKLKQFTRIINANELTMEDLHSFIRNLNINDHIKTELYDVTLNNYTGLCSFIE